MKILIDTVRIAGFRGIKEIEVFLPRVTVLIGTNNSGKTSFLKAMHLALGDYSRYLSEEDFYIGDDENRVQQILVDVKVVPIGNNGKRSKLFNDVWATEVSCQQWTLSSQAAANLMLKFCSNTAGDK